jgi:hypothetical protein
VGYLRQIETLDIKYTRISELPKRPKPSPSSANYAFRKLAELIQYSGGH